MSLYPSVEDLKVDKEITAQVKFAAEVVREAQAVLPPSASGGEMVVVSGSSLYPVSLLQSYMGLDVSESALQSRAPGCIQPVALCSLQPHGALQPVAPVTALSGGLAGMQRAEIKQGVRQVQLCRGRDGKFGFRMASINSGIFIGFVHKDSPAAMVGLRFGDQILEINGKVVAGWSEKKASDELAKLPVNGNTFVVRDRPFERTVTLQKDSSGTLGIVLKGGRITHIAKDSSAARNGLLTEHALVELNGQNVVALKDSEVAGLIDRSGQSVTLTVLPAFIYDHMIKTIGTNLLKKMDRSVPEY